MDEEEVHIAVGKIFRKEKANILWAAANFPTATIALVHVHWPSKRMPFMGGKVSYKFADEKEKEMHRGRETDAMVRMLSQYKSLCGTRKVRVHYLAHDDILAGVVNLIKKLKIKRIIIGSRNMSKQAVLRKCCQIWVVLNGKHISTSDDHLEHTGSIGYGGSPEFLASIHELGDESDGYTTPPRVLCCLKSMFMKYIWQKYMGHKHEESILSPRQKVASLKKTLSKPRYPELQIPEHIAQLSMSQIGKATNNFYSRNLIGEGGYGPVYKGKVGGMPVAIKLLRPHDKQGFPEYQQEVVVLSRIEHPHIVRLVGVCPESCGLVYEHLPNGTLLDRLSKGLAWKDRVRILAEQRSALAYLHSSRPHAIIHADLKLTNVLLDAGNVSRLGDFGMARMVHMKPLEEETICRRTNPMGTMGYMDPVFCVYAFGVVILQVLTGLLDLNIAEQVWEAVKMGAVRCMLDASAGSWPEVQAERLLRLALRCCSQERKRRPAITSDADWRSLYILQAMATAAGKSRIWNHGS